MWSEQGFWANVGVVTVMLNCLSGLAFAFAVSSYSAKPVSHVWWTGVLWTAFLALGLERLVLRITGGRRWWTMLLIVVQRILISLIIAVSVAEPAVIALNGGKIQHEITSERNAELANTTSSLANTWQTKIGLLDRQMTAINAHEHRLKQLIAHNTYLSRCSTAVACGTARLNAQSYISELAGYRQRVAPLVARDQTEIPAYVTAEKTALQNASSGINGDRGLPEQEHALAQVAARDTTAAVEVWFVRIAMFIFDLIPLSTKLIKLASGSAYDDALHVRALCDRVHTVVGEENALTDIHRARMEGRNSRATLDERMRVRRRGSDAV